ncbi:hypothetical protein [Amycolatopsis sp. WGS_07]|uniref:hypothetical protein n=1 Tax=Amycolatopsis sp. WGS_07 TaxID=3076764 RepID=UPI003873C9E5
MVDRQPQPKPGFRASNVIEPCEAGVQFADERVDEGEFGPAVADDGQEAVAGVLPLPSRRIEVGRLPCRAHRADERLLQLRLLTSVAAAVAPRVRGDEQHPREFLVVRHPVLP